MSESEIKTCKPQSARPDPYQSEVGDPEVELAAQAPGKVTSRAFLCVSRHDHAHRIAQFRVHGNLLQNQVRIFFVQ